MLPAVNITREALRPCLAEVLRTCVRPASLLLQVEYVLGQAQEGSHRNEAGSAAQSAQRGTTIEGYDDESVGLGNESLREQTASSIKEHNSAAQPRRLALSDGHLQIQAVLNTDLLVHLHPIESGDLLHISGFEVRSAPRVNGRGRVIYLAVQACDKRDKAQRIAQIAEPVDIKGADSARTGSDKMSPTKPVASKSTPDSYDYKSWSRRSKPMQEPVAAHSSSTSGHIHHQPTGHDDESEEDAFDRLPVSRPQLEQRRQKLRDVQETPVSGKVATNRLTSPRKSYSQVEPESPAQSPAKKRPHPDTTVVKAPIDGSRRPAYQPNSERDQDQMTGPNVPRPQHHTGSHPLTLATLLAQPVQKSYACPPLFGVISWINPSLIHKPNTPFPPKRHLKIHDPSIASRYSGMTIAVFVDAEKFKPAVGTIGLFRGLIMNWVQSGQDVILNRYPPRYNTGSIEVADRDEAEQEWFVNDLGQLVELGYDVEGLRKWWNERVAARQK